MHKHVFLPLFDPKDKSSMLSKKKFNILVHLLDCDMVLGKNKRFES